MLKLSSILLPGVLAIALSSTANAKQDSLSGLEQALKETGWSVERTADGDLLLIAPAQGKPETGTEIDLESLRSKLEASGWKVVRQADGSLVLYPRRELVTTDSAKGASSKLPDNQWEQLQEELQAAGWNSTRDSDGSLILIPPGSTPETSTSVEKQSKPMAGMQRKLREAGWRVSENSDGSILLYPPEQPRGVATLKPCPGVTPSIEIDLPVNSWGEVNTLAEAWLKQQSLTDVTVGRVRNILKIYLVSIVSHSKPHKLLHQIAIRKSDGHIIVLH